MYLMYMIKIGDLQIELFTTNSFLQNMASKRCVSAIRIGAVFTQIQLRNINRYFTFTIKIVFVRS